MKTMYRIKWQSLETQAVGYGEPVFNSYEMAQHTASEFNKSTPHIAHWVEAVAVSNEEASKKQ